jgi:alpha-D-ribose 1-methylphosphonate 5-triphosphate diphosphatase PhnM
VSVAVPTTVESHEARIGTGAPNVTRGGSHSGNIVPLRPTFPHFVSELLKF